MARPLPGREWLLVIGMLALVWWPHAAVAAVILTVAAQGEWWVLGAPLVGLAAWVVEAVRGPTEFPGRAVRPDDEPELAALVRTVARRLAFEGPLLVRIAPDPTAALTRLRVRGVRTYVLLLGLPLLRTLTEAQLAAVVAHELAHRRHSRHPRETALRIARDALENRLSGPLRFLTPYAPRLLRASQLQAWRAETAADADAAHVAGTTAAAEALERVHATGVVFHGLGATWWCALEQAGRRPQDFYDALDAAQRDPHVARRAAMWIAEDDAFDPYATDSHPPHLSRIAALPPADPPGDLRSVPLTLRTAPEVERWCLDRLGSDPQVTLDGLWEEHRSEITRASAPTPVHLLDIDPDELRRLVDDLIEEPDLRTATHRNTPAEALAAALDAVDDGTWPSLADLIDRQIRTAPAAVRPALRRDAFRTAVTSALETVLRADGWTSTVRWLSTVLTAPDGTVADLSLLVTEAVDSADASGLRDLLAGVQTQDAA
ncbi:M48 family metalloprotease [Streptomyces sp. S6]